MTFLTAFTVLVALVCLLNLALTLGVIRRLREQRPAGGASEAGAPAVVMGPGGAAGPFSARDTAGAVVSRDALAEGSFVLFMSPGCPACEDLLPLVAERAGEYGPDRVLAVVIREEGEDELLGEYVRRMSPVARVVVTDFGSELTTAFGLQGMPAYVELGPAGQIASSGRTLPRRADLAGQHI
ncbi:hypothetical protein [Longispora albida]|uniref:hypothetical protein n=1 Tax=Longispora albida TaxID=203523 RepID=UPI00036A1C00|nr:hypothetical protein [Longispora albida]